MCRRPGGRTLFALIWLTVETAFMPSQRKIMTHSIEKSKSWQMFNQISPKYDLLNRILSMGLDISWREEMGRQLIQRDDMQVLDLATGTGDVIISFCQQYSNIKQGQGLDLAEKMLSIGREKIEKLNLSQRIKLDHGDAMSVPFPDKIFDNVSISFGIRNTDNPFQVLKEMRRVLKPGGRALILEFSMPANKIIRFFHLFYLRHIVPLLGYIFSGNYQAYKYLNQTIESFPHGQSFCKMMHRAGLKNIQETKLLYGTATIYTGER
jgi:demethylmenaquinone methyltransferase/2-methoxy-6-polyprenyl-1,4-benzoquinol methylase